MFVCGRMTRSKSSSIIRIANSVEIEPKQFSMSKDASLCLRRRRVFRRTLSAARAFLMAYFGLLYALASIVANSFDVLYATVLTVDVINRIG